MHGTPRQKEDNGGKKNFGLNAAGNNWRHGRERKRCAADGGHGEKGKKETRAGEGNVRWKRSLVMTFGARLATDLSAKQPTPTQLKQDSVLLFIGTP
jgi:hypothetical protein